MPNRLSKEAEVLIITLRSVLFEQYQEAHGFKLFMNEDYVDVEVGELNGELITIQSHMKKSSEATDY